MTQRLQLRPWQVAELRLYVDGPIPRKPSTNLLRRGLADEIPGRKFRLTEKGAGALAQADSNEDETLPRDEENAAEWAQRMSEGSNQESKP